MSDAGGGAPLGGASGACGGGEWSRREVPRRMQRYARRRRRLPRQGGSRGAKYGYRRGRARAPPHAAVAP